MRFFDFDGVLLQSDRAGEDDPKDCSSLNFSATKSLSLKIEGGDIMHILLYDNQFIAHNV